MAKWSSGFKIASLSTKRKLLCISEALWFHDSEGAAISNVAVSKCIFDTKKPELLARGEMLAQVDYQDSH